MSGSNQTVVLIKPGSSDYPHAYREVMESSANQCFVSIVSLWEIALKSSIGKLPLHMPLSAFFNTVEQAGFTTQVLAQEHLLTSAQLPMHHCDPFDRC